MDTLNNTDKEKVENIIIVDDLKLNLELLKNILSFQGYKVRIFTSGDQAVFSAKDDPPDLFMLDICMPEMTGYELCAIIKSDSLLNEIPVIFISALSEPFDKVQAFSCGASDYITKPYYLEEVATRVKCQLTIRRLQQNLKRQNVSLQDTVFSQMEEINRSQQALITAMIKLAEARDDDTGSHIERIQVFTKMIASDLYEKKVYPEIIDEQFINTIYQASPLHDIGKVAIPDKILLKPAQLDTDEFEIMKTHAAIGARTLELVRETYPRNAFINMGISIARHHHERWDGLGYPSGLCGEEVPLSARIMQVCDVYDALRSKRVYKEGFSHSESVRIIQDGNGKLFDPIIAECFFKLEHEFEIVYRKTRV